MYIPKPGLTPETPSADQVLPTATSMPNAETLSVSIWVPAYLAETMGSALEDPLRGLFINDPAQATIRLEVGTGNPVSQWVYAPVTPFSSTLQGVSSQDLLLYWQGQSTSGQQLLMDQNSYEMFTALWGLAGNTGVQVLTKQELVDYAWAHQPAVAIVPFEDLSPRWKVLPVDGLSPIHKDFDLAQYRLKIPISLNSDPDRVALIQSNFVIPPSNLDPQKMTVVVMTGVTALRETLPLRQAAQAGYLAWAVDAFRLATGGAADDTQVHTHMCYAEFGDVLDAIIATDADVISLEAARSDMAIVRDLARAGYPREVGPGVWDIHSPRVPSTEEITTLLRAAVATLPVERLWVNPDCGLKTRGYGEVGPSLEHLVAAARIVRAELA